MIEGKITRISGPIVFAEGLDGCGLYDVVDVGEKKLIGEIIRQNKGKATVQVYEDDTGMCVGEKIVCQQRPLSLRLGPGLVGTIYDGIQRPLKTMAENSGAFLLPGERTEPLDVSKVWHFEALDGIAQGSPIKPGLAIGTVKETESITQKIMIPPTVRGRVLMTFKGSGDYTVDDVIATTELDEEIKLSQYWPVRQPRPYADKLEVSEPLITGQRVIDVFFPLSKGGTAAIPGGFGTGKTMTQHAVAKWCDADLIVYIGCGERGNEMTEVLTEFPELIDPRTGRSIMERTILIANTSNMPVAAREVSLYSGITLAEYFRDMGMHVAIMADSTSRWAEALRELSGRMEEMPAEEGFPAYLPTRLASFYERAGRIISLNGQEGSVSVIGAVSPPGGDFSEPVTQHTKRFIRCFWALNRELANARHYPAIGWIDSYSEYAAEVREWWENHNPVWWQVRTEALELLKKEQRLEQIVRLVGPDALPDSDRLILKVSEMIKNGFLQQNAFDDIDMYCSSEKQIMILELMVKFYRKALNVVKNGCPLTKINSLSVSNDIVRIKMDIPNDKLDKIQEIQLRMDTQFSELESVYNKAVTL
ncbi:MAG: V-type ATP synthase subunit A [Treponema porcinum]|uniref:V-type ATP synthase subunit A n=1 Tax=Treponema TaxID=157 RepID=UPI002352C8C7|nr:MULTISPECIES: V-type ATP synthase subunit A [Treponema]MCI6322158.1 V-type ATP synthase subunit A [Treponema porcinum]MCI6815850.1 V-type ATP synthase subunit A [Treponema porcinum]MCI6983960.1 V-type ATP synthase subunit A [Treponema porcinum]MCI7079890.1 V-type ATP synthase subunit A [Treponema porcinum]MCI7115308.1 V-type ATP synthase subunit A [Treponema porcinum]